MRTGDLENRFMSIRVENRVEKNEPKTIEAECQNCGVTVQITLPFYGCVFCSDCMKGVSYETADASEFKQRHSWG